MIFEPKPHEIPDLALMPVGGWPDIADGIDFGHILGSGDLEAEMRSLIDGVQFIDHLEPRISSEIIDGTEIEQHVVAELVAGVKADVTDARGIEGQRCLPTEFRTME